jgi:hypothetical protein
MQCTPGTGRTPSYYYKIDKGEEVVTLLKELHQKSSDIEQQLNCLEERISTQEMCS